LGWVCVFNCDGLCPSADALCRLLADEVGLCVSPKHGHDDDGWTVDLAVRHSSVVDRDVGARYQLLFLAGDGTNEGRGTLPKRVQDLGPCLDGLSVGVAHSPYLVHVSGGGESHGGRPAPR